LGDWRSQNDEMPTNLWEEYGSEKGDRKKKESKGENQRNLIMKLK